MTIQDLIDNANGFCSLAERETTRDRGSLEKAAQYAQIASASAFTAMAMMQANLIAEAAAERERKELQCAKASEPPF